MKIEEANTPVASASPRRRLGVGKKISGLLLFLLATGIGALSFITSQLYSDDVSSFLEKTSVTARVSSVGSFAPSSRP